MAGGSGAPSARRWSARRMHYWMAWLCALPLLVSAVTGTAYRVLRSAGAAKSSVKWLMRVHTMEVLQLHAVYPLLLFSLLAVLLVSGFSMTWPWLRLRACCRARRGSNDARNNLSRALEQYERLQQSGGRNSSSDSSAAPSAAADSTSLTDAIGVASSVGTAAEESEWSEADDAVALSGLGGTGSSGVHVFRRVSGSSPPRRTLRQRLRSCFPSALGWRWLHRAVATFTVLPLALTATTGAMYVFAGSWVHYEKSEYKVLLYLHEGRWLESSGTLYVALLGGATLLMTAAGMLGLYKQSGASGAIAGAVSRSADAGAASRNTSGSPSSLAYARTRDNPPSGSSNSRGAGGRVTSTATREEADLALDEDDADLQAEQSTRQTLARIHQAFALDAATAEAAPDESEHTDDDGLFASHTGAVR